MTSLLSDEPDHSCSAAASFRRNDDLQYSCLQHVFLSWLAGDSKHLFRFTLTSTTTVLRHCRNNGCICLMLCTGGEARRSERREEERKEAWNETNGSISAAYAWDPSRQQRPEPSRARPTQPNPSSRQWTSTAQSCCCHCKHYYQSASPLLIHRRHPGTLVLRR